MFGPPLDSLRFRSNSLARAIARDHPHLLPDPDLSYPHGRLVTSGISTTTSTGLCDTDQGHVDQEEQGGRAEWEGRRRYGRDVGTEMGGQCKVRTSISFRIQLAESFLPLDPGSLVSGSSKLDARPLLSPASCLCKTTDYANNSHPIIIGDRTSGKSGTTTASPCTSRSATNEWIIHGFEHEWEWAASRGTGQAEAARHAWFGRVRRSCAEWGKVRGESL